MLFRSRANDLKGAPDCPVCTGQCPVRQRLQNANGRLCQNRKEIRTGQCPVVHRTVRCARRQKARIAFLECSQRLLAALGLMISFMAKPIPVDKPPDTTTSHVLFTLNSPKTISNLSLIHIYIHTASISNLAIYDNNLSVVAREHMVNPRKVQRVELVNLYATFP